MSRISLEVNPMPAMAARAVRAINDHFNRMATVEAHRDAAHLRKREMARRVIGSEQLAEDHPFAVEAGLRGLSVTDFAALVLTKPDNVQARELERQTMLLAVVNATTPAEIETITAGIAQ